MREDLRTGEGLGVLLRKVPRDEVQGDDLRPLRREGHPQPRPPQAHGPHRVGSAGRPHMVLQGNAEPPRGIARHEDVELGEGDLLPGLRRSRPKGYAAEAPATPHRRGVPRSASQLRRNRLRCRDGGRGGAQAPPLARSRQPLQGAPRGTPHDWLEAEEEGPRQSPQDRRSDP